MKNVPVPKAATIEEGLEYSEITPAPPLRVPIESMSYRLLPTEMPPKSVRRYSCQQSYASVMQPENIKTETQKKTEIKEGKLGPTTGPECTS